MKVYLYLIVAILAISCNNVKEQLASDLIQRTLGDSAAQSFVFNYKPEKGNDKFSYYVKDNKVYVSGNSVVAMCGGAYKNNNKIQDINIT